MTGKEKKINKNGNSKNNIKDQTQEEESELLKLYREREEARQKTWTECWDKKVREHEALEDRKVCYAPDEYFRDPRAQSSIWVQVNHEKNSQQVLMSFKNVRVPKPKPPPLSRLKITDVQKELKQNDSKPIIDEKKPNEKKKKKKKNK